MAVFLFFSSFECTQKIILEVKYIFQKGNKNSAPIKFDGAIFDDINWFEHYKEFHTKSRIT